MKGLKKICFGLVLMFLFLTKMPAQLGINTDGSDPNASAMLDVKSTDKGILIPRLANTSAISSPVEGLMIYQTTAPKGFYYYDGTVWKLVGDGVADADASTTNELNTAVTLDGTTLKITDAGGTKSADLSSLSGGGGLSFSINGMNSDLTLIDFNAQNFVLLSDEGYFVYIESSGLHIGNTSIYFSGPNCTGSATSTALRGQVFEYGNSGTLAYVHKDADRISAPFSPQSRWSSSSNRVCESYTTTRNTDYPVILPHDSNVTGITLSPDTVYKITW